MDPSDRAARLEREFKESYVLKSSQRALEEKKTLLITKAIALINESFATISDDQDSLQTGNELLKFKEEHLQQQIHLLEGLKVTELEEIIAL